MSGFKSTYTCNKVLDLIFGGQGWTPPATLYCALFTVMPNAAGAGATEVTGGSYARVAVTNNLTNFPAAGSAQKQNGALIDFGTPSAAWGTVVGAGWYDASTGGNLIEAGPLSTSRVVGSGVPFSIPIGGFVATEA